MLSSKYNILAVLLTVNVTSVLSVPISVPSDEKVSGSERLGLHIVPRLAEVPPMPHQGFASGSSHSMTLVTRSQTNWTPGENLEKWIVNTNTVRGVTEDHMSNTREALSRAGTQGSAAEAGSHRVGEEKGKQTNPAANDHDGPTSSKNPPANQG
ncbi:hypothetical protein EV361DRAFT_43346 [Lentinula raphanica]|nr:hypothetical protein F5880DRAFT_1607613 [Lentinula raphanica]KAJ3973659.1 hypothetical protein EV361DRAFT_43346 [Lentinula raphanica]